MTSPLPILHQPGDSGPDISEGLINWVQDWILEAAQSGYLDTDIDDQLLNRVMFLTVLVTQDWMVNCGHMDMLSLTWSTIFHDTDMSAASWMYKPSLADVSYDVNELDFWRMTEDRDGKSVLDQRIEKLGKFELDKQERSLGLGYVEVFLRESLETEEQVRRVKKLSQVAFWATLMWTLSSDGWDYLIDSEPGGLPRAVIPAGISLLPTEKNPAGFACQPRNMNQGVLDPRDDSLMVWGRLLHPDRLVPRLKFRCNSCHDVVHMEPDGERRECKCGASTGRLDGWEVEVDGPMELIQRATCANEDCNEVTHCLKRVLVKGAGGKYANVHLCDRCREKALAEGFLVHPEEHLPEEAGGTGGHKKYDCLRMSGSGTPWRPYCRTTKSCRWNDQDGLARTLTKDTEHKTRQRIKQVADGTNPLLGTARKMGLLM